MIARADRVPFRARLIVVVDLEYAGSEPRCLALLATCARAAVGRPVALQVRAHGLAPDALRTFATRARAEVSHDVPVLLNGAPALASELGYDGAHTPEADIPLERAAGHWLSVAIHGMDGLSKAERADADLVVFGAVFDPGSHAGTGAGVEALRAITAAATRPVFAIGGISPERVRACVDAGAAGVAVISGVLGVPDPAEAITRYCDALEAAR